MNLQQFNGPPDSLLPSIQKQEINLFDISLYLFVHSCSQEEKTLNKGPAFIALAAHLIYLKSVQLVPQKKEDTVLEAPEEWTALNQSDEYDSFQQMAKTFVVKEQEQAQYFLRGVMALPEVQEEKESTATFGLDEFSRLFLQVWQQAEERSKTIWEEEWNVADVLVELRRQLRYKELMFEDLFAKEFTKDRLITTFLAVLELLKHQEAKLLYDKIKNNWYLR